MCILYIQNLTEVLLLFITQTSHNLNFKSYWTIFYLKTGQRMIVRLMMAFLQFMWEKTDIKLKLLKKGKVKSADVKYF
jgi:hypothetical protein